jgi:Protein of unknown function (DUF559)
MDVDLRKRIGQQDDLVATWQLRRAGWSRMMVGHWATKEAWRQIHDGVWAVGQAPLTERQRRIAAVLTAPHTFLAAESACAHHGFIEWHGDYETVVRPGSGGKRRYPGVVVARSAVLAGQTMRMDGIPIVCAERALIDVAPRLSVDRLGRGFREACRLKCTTANEIARSLNGQRGTRFLVELCDRYASVPYHRCRSDAECRGLEVLHDAGVLPPRVNVRVAGREADFVWRQWKLIVEIDSKEWHQFTDLDAAKQALWEAAGYTVKRVWANDVYRRPHILLAQVNGHMCRL